MAAQRGDPVGRRARRPERGRRQVADVAVARELDPAPVAALLIDDGRLAIERFGVERRFEVGRAPQRRDRRDDAQGLAGDEARRFDPAA